jgi:hypothetical protein
MCCNMPITGIRTNQNLNESGYTKEWHHIKNPGWYKVGKVLNNDTVDM